MTEKEKLVDQAQALVVQKHQLTSAQAQLGQLDSALSTLNAGQQGNQELLDKLIAQAEASLNAQEIIFEFEEHEAFLVESSVFILPEEEASTSIELLSSIDSIEISDTTDWSGYLDGIDHYVARNNILLNEDPFRELLTPTQRIALEKRIKEEFSLKGANCDKYDYMIAGTCGLIGGMIDVFFVGLPGQGKLTQFSDDMTDNAVQKFAKFCGWKGPKEGSDSVASAIGFLERNFKVNYDHQHGTAVGKRFDMSTKNHHLKNLGHSPDLVGLFFSIWDQFNSTANFVAIFDDVDGLGNKIGEYTKIITVDTETFELKGSNMIAKIFSGFVNWLGHLFSDVAGSSGAQGRGSGIPIPFFSLLQFASVGSFGMDKKSFATIAVDVFQKGYDLRHGMAMAIPVLITELLTRITWVIKQRFYHKQLWSDCMPSANNPELRRMLLIAHGSLCLVDTTDAALRSGGDIVQFMLRSNMIAWARFGTLALKELRAWYKEGSLDVESVDAFLDAEYKRILAA
ncbi:hypothetical protein ACS8E9_17670 [Pseudomonas neustonica]|uniref:hypothetical protein n=1 Tax=Pseudomonas neustonica TaxID=2487346 RepID=UPI003F44D18B